VTRTRRLSLCLAAALVIATGAAAAEAPPVEPGLRLLQVMAPRLRLLAEPRDGAEARFEIARGRLLEVVSARDDWIEVRVRGASVGAVERADETAWLKRDRLADGQWNVAPMQASGAPRIAGPDGVPVPAIEPLLRPGGDVAPLVTLPAPAVGQVDAPAPNLPRESVSVPDRWRIMQGLGFRFPWYDPYHQNVLKGDLPIREWGDDVFLALNLVSDTLAEARRFPVPVAQVIGTPGQGNDLYGRNRFEIGAQTLILSASIIKGNTTFKPPDYEYRIVPVLNINRVVAGEAGLLRINPEEGRGRTDQFIGLQELFYDRHLRNVSDRYDFDSLRIGIQPFTSDFRGFLFLDQPFGVRLFGNRDNNHWQYNLAWFRRMEKDTNSGLNDVTEPLRNDDIYVANVYRQDWPRLGFTSQATVLHNRNREDRFHYDTNGFLVRPAFLGDLRPHRYNVTYLGVSGDGHLTSWFPSSRLNLTTTTYIALGTDERHPLAQRRQTIRAAFHASELSRDFSWIRLRGSLLYASGDKDPYDDKATGFDAIFENPQFAGADTSYFIRQTIPLVGGGGVALSARNGLLPSLRSSKEQGQSNFVNPGLALVGVGADFDVLPELRVVANLNHLRFIDTEVLGVLRNEAPPPKAIGWDASVGLQWRPLFIQNIVVNGSIAVLKPGDGIKRFYGTGQGTLYSGLINAILTF
jgi:hypothetical protein